MPRLGRRLLIASALAVLPSCDAPEKCALRELSRAGVQPSGRALVDAVIDGEDQHVRWLLRGHVHTEQRDATGCTPLRIAVEQHRPSMAIMLREAGVDANSKSPDGTSVLAAAIVRDSTPVVEKLIASGASPSGLMPGGEKILPWCIPNCRRPRLHPPAHGLRQETLRHDRSRQPRHHQAVGGLRAGRESPSAQPPSTSV